MNKVEQYIDKLNIILKLKNKPLLSNHIKLNNNESIMGKVIYDIKNHDKYNIDKYNKYTYYRFIYYGNHIDSSNLSCICINDKFNQKHIKFFESIYKKISYNKLVTICYSIDIYNINYKLFLSIIKNVLKIGDML